MLQLQLAGEGVQFEVRRLIAAGYTGRNQAAVQQHIHELELQGVPPPAGVPSFYRIEPALVSSDAMIELETSTASGEAEAVMLFPSADIQDALVAVGSDITDRVLERRSVVESKQLPKPISREIWRWRDVRNAWDELELASYVTEQQDRCYQRGTLASLLPPAEVIARLPADVRSDLTGTVLFLGTIPLCEPDFRFSDYFACELRVPDGEALRCAYRVVTNRGGIKG